MEEKSVSITLRRSASHSSADRMAALTESKKLPTVLEDASQEVARENIVKGLMRIFDGLLGCTPKRAGVKRTYVKVEKMPAAKPESATRRTLEKEIYRLITNLVEHDSPNTGFAVNVLVNNGIYYYNKAAVPLSFGIFLTSLVEFLEGHDCLSICPEEMAKLKALLSRG
ncbi:MAG: hypothetical protein PHI31_14570 [Desulfuromonadaceae bacterium]|nr:hypothetical protein [Desulfuromonadaceae bacterium]